MNFLGIKLNNRGERVLKTVRFIIAIPTAMAIIIIVMGLPNFLFELLH